LSLQFFRWSLLPHAPRGRASRYCIHHSREDRQLLETERIPELLAATPSGEFLTATDVNSVLGRLYTAIALNRIPHRNAALMAYVGQLLLHATPPPKSALPVDLRQDLIDPASEEHDEEQEEIVEQHSDEHRQEGNFDPEAEEEYEVSEPPGIGPSSHNEEYDAKNNEPRWLSDLKACAQGLHPKKL
jgi:hypothetical protein